jgi:hypothetical protein
MIFKPLDQYKHRWARRIVIVLVFPAECFRAVRGMFRAAVRYWNLP